MRRAARCRSRSATSIAPQKVMSTLGADVLRLWVAATDYANEISVSDEILKRMADSYRRMRNTVRFLLGNLHGFDPTKHAVKPSEMVALDRWALARARAAAGRSDRARIARYEFHLIYQKVHNFCVVDMGGFYLDVLKDRLYTMPRESRARRSAQTAMYHIAESMVRWLAPILSFTAEEIWRYLPGERAESVFLDHLACAARSAGGRHRLGRAHRAARRRAARARRSCAMRGDDRRAARSGGRRLLPPGAVRTVQCAAAMSCGSCSSPPRRACIGWMRRSTDAATSCAHGRRVDLREADGSGQMRALLASAAGCGPERRSIRSSAARCVTNHHRARRERGVYA